MIDRSHDLLLSRQAVLLRLSRSSLYYGPPARAGGGTGDHAADRRATPGLPVRGQPNVA